MDLLSALSKEIYMECLLPNTVILKQGDAPTAAYVMIQGTASVHVEITYKTFDKVKTKAVSNKLGDPFFRGK